MTLPHALQSTRSRVRRLVCALGAGCLLHAPFAHAQQSRLDAGALQRNLESQLPPASPLELKEPVPPVPETRAPAQGEPVVTVSRFELSGVLRIDPSQVQDALQAFLHRPLTLDDLQQACDTIEKLYRALGYLAHATVPPQTVQDGVLGLAVTEAKLSAVLVDTPNAESRFGVERAASYITWANPTGQDLDLNAVTRALTVLSETPGLSVTSAMESGKQDGETQLRLTLKESASQSATVEANNNGSRSTGVPQSVLQATFNNPLGWGDQFTANGIYAQGSSYTQAAYYFPLMPNGLRGGLSGSTMHYSNVPGYQTNGGYGDARTLSASLAYPVIRSPEGNANATVRYDRKTYLNMVSATDAVSSSYHLHNIHLGLSGNRYDEHLGGGMTSAQLSLVIGHLELQSNNPSNFGLYTPSRFLKLAFSGNRVQTVAPGVSKVLISLSAQLANENLNSAEQFYLGGPYGVRAYPVAQAGGAQGAQATVEYQHTLSDDLIGMAFVDSGIVQQYVHTYTNWQGNTHASNTYSLHGAGIGLKWTYRGLNLAATLAWKLGNNPLYSQQGQAVDIDNRTTNPRGWLTASYSF